MNRVSIEYFGHSCFRLTYAGQRIVLDPYADGNVPGYPPLRLEAEFVYCSHGHDDHNAVECVALQTHGAPEFTVEEIETEHDHHGGTKRGKNTIRIFTFGTFRLAHLGDLGRPLKAEEAAKLQGLDCALIPVGGYFTINAAEAKAAADAVAPKTVIPMHYRTDTAGYDVIGRLEEFLMLYPDGADAPRLIVMQYGETIEK